MSDFIDATEKAVHNVVAWLIAAILSGGVWVVRRVFTNQKQIEALQTEIRSREEMRQRDRDDLKEVKSDVKQLREEIVSLFRSHK